MINNSKGRAALHLNLFLILTTGKWSSNILPRLNIIGLVTNSAFDYQFDILQQWGILTPYFDRD